MKRAIASVVLGFFLVASVSVAEAGGGYYHHHHNHHHGHGDAKIVGIVVGAVLGIGIFASFLGRRDIDETNRLAIQEEHRTQREKIRADTVLAAPSALGSSRRAVYRSTEGSAEIYQESGQYYRKYHRQYRRY